MNDELDEEYEQIGLFDSYIYSQSKEIEKIATLKRSKTPLISKVVMDEKVSKASESFDYDFTGENKFYPFEWNRILDDLDFQILVITGASGSGKSVFSRYFGKEEVVEWDNSKSVISNFDSAEEGIEKLCATGLSSIPAWCRPYEVLSVGEKFRADLARKLKDNCIIDEFTSTVNRETALSCSASVSKYIRRKNLKKCVFVSCHKDFIDTLCPDYVIDLDDSCIYDTRRLLRRRFKLSVNEMWQIFKRHHYLSADLNVSAKMFIAYLENTPVACCAILPQPGVKTDGVFLGNGWRVHRLVVLPDYQGLGIATKLLEYLCDMFAYHNKVVYLRTSHIKLRNYMLKSPKWKGDGKMIHSNKQNGILKHIIPNEKRLSTSFRYIEKCQYNPNYNYELITFSEKTEDDDVFEQMTLW